MILHILIISFNNHSFEVTLRLALMSHVVLEVTNDICIRITETSRKEVTINQF